ncbi:MAG: Bug family tripartite tricarboxylate transporter substrate binding protein [Betaproteobacteria bacterium]
MKIRAFFSITIVIASLINWPMNAIANDSFPSRVVKVIVPYPAGGTVDNVVRLYTERLSKMWGTQVVVENKPGADGNIGVTEAMRGSTDGHTLLVHGPAMVANPSLYSNLTWHPSRNFRTLGVLAWVPQIAVAATDVPAKTMRELENLARKDPGKLFYGVPGAGSGNNLSTQLFLQAVGVEMTPVQYKGQPEAVMDLLANRLNFMFVSPSIVLQHISSGKLRALAIAGPSRLPQLPDTPTMAESGYPSAVRPFWFSMFALAGTPEQVLQKINADLVKVAGTGEVQAALRAGGYQPPSALTVTQADSLVRLDTEAWGSVIRKAGIKAE